MESKNTRSSPIMTGTDELVSKVTNFYNNLYKDCPDFSDDVKTSFLAKIIDEVKKSGIVEAAEGTSEENAWYKTAVGYSMYVDKFCGTFDGLKELLDAEDSTLPEMGVSLLHLLPILDDGGADGGFDIKDYTRIRPSLFRDPGDKEGNTETFTAFLAAARERGMRVLFDVALNHCSVQHEWFETAVAAINAHVTEGTPLPADPAHPFNFFIWTTHRGPGYPTSPAYDEPNVRRIFSFEPSNWARVGETPYFYLHRFKTEQPDLNYHNPAVLLESVKIIAFWAHAGVGGLRLDALPYLWKVDRQKTHERDWVCENESGTHIIVQLWRAIADALRPADDALLLLLRVEPGVRRGRQVPRQARCAPRVPRGVQLPRLDPNVARSRHTEPCHPHRHVERGRRPRPPRCYLGCYASVPRRADAREGRGHPSDPRRRDHRVPTGPLVEVPGNRRQRGAGDRRRHLCSSGLPPQERPRLVDPRHCSPALAARHSHDLHGR
ncbi:Alpha amylase, catalytic domain [Carpediemonas membranifera]|uniref:Alpha amylase, catalytic domain n=1 Tax=Carpediemonas membranifera TaxID=201153 RepID=A0A8J6APZ3_9EUKA|nr:Alpha amylase, catalytic domain [Carpediemonas membranifera]|eukprot:KAG9390736.1 Alpha amylase, catalytic domain [Carpediemonas membranifera]